MQKFSCEWLFCVAPVGFLSRFRIAFYKFMGMKLGVNNRFEVGRCRRFVQIRIGSNNVFSSGIVLWPMDEPFSGERIIIGDDNYFNRNVMIDSGGIIEIGNANMFGPDIYITDSNHKYKYGMSSKSLPMSRGRVTIGNNCWIGAKVIILKDVTLGNNCVVAAGAVVTKSFESGSVIAGVPAKLIKYVDRI
jgi:maltose O-acetyltransferase